MVPTVRARLACRRRSSPSSSPSSASTAVAGCRPRLLPLLLSFANPSPLRRNDCASRSVSCRRAWSSSVNPRPEPGGGTAAIPRQGPFPPGSTDRRMGELRCPHPPDRSWLWSRGPGAFPAAEVAGPGYWCGEAGKRGAGSGETCRTHTPCLASFSSGKWGRARATCPPPERRHAATIGRRRQESRARSGMVRVDWCLPLAATKDQTINQHLPARPRQCGTRRRWTLAWNGQTRMPSAPWLPVWNRCLLRRIRF